uniref:G_PROTEIN_RECEP_F1_2 domain-containing protein n=1 Tax=Rhabditophanes sp. KR3021 TaxID=114890 RepID=A0AC35U932_9BILA
MLSLLVLGKVFTDVYTVMFGLSLMDLLFSTGTVYSGFYGLIVVLYGNGNNYARPNECLSSALQLVLWIISDFGQFLFVLLLAFDRLFNSIDTTFHEKFQKYVMNGVSIIFVMVVSIGTFVPFCNYSIEMKANQTLAIYSGCYEKDVFGIANYSILWNIRFYIACSTTVILGLASITYAVRSMIPILNYANTAFDNDTVEITIIAVIRTISQMLISSMFTILISHSETSDNLYRLCQTILIIILQPFLYYIVLLKFKKAFTQTFEKYIQNPRRTWQSADDPPEEYSGDINSIYGSWYSMSGNITGEAGIPTVNDFHNAASVSFYGRDNSIVIEESIMIEEEKF